MLNGMVWGDGGKMVSAEDRAARRRALAQQLDRGVDTSPVGHWTQGAARVANALFGAMGERKLAAEQEEADKSGMAALTGLMGGGGFPAMASVGGAPVATGSATGSGATKVVNAPEQFAPLFAEKEAKFGLPSGYLARTAQIESNFNPNAKNPNSSATGLFQFINSTARQYGLDNPRDPVAATAAAARLAADNKAHLQRVLGREPTAGELYLAHQQGAGGAAKLLTNPNASASSVVGDAAARLNRGAGMTASTFANQWINKFGMPVVKPGDGAAPMPLARQQAQTARMPNAAMADMPAQNANPSSMEARPVAPVSGDNPQQLLADADYYEKNGNPEAARQMRERAQMAGQGAPAMAQGGPPMAPGGGVAIANNEDDVRFLEARMAAEQGNPPAPMPAQDPSQMQTVAITPNAQNAGDVFSNVPMGLGANQFVQRAPFAPSPDQAAPMAQEAAINPAASVAPSRDTVPLPPEPVMQQQAPMMPPQRPMAMGFNPAMGGENGISPQMFADAEFAAREGRPAPGMMPQGQAQAAPAMSPVQSVAAAMSQGGAQMAAQAPEQPSPVQRVAGAIPPGDRLAQLATIAANPSISPQIRTVAATMWQKESERMNRDPRDSELKDIQIAEARAKMADRPLTTRQLELQNQKAERDLRGEGAVPLSPQERVQFGVPEGQPAFRTRSGDIKFGPAGTRVNVDASQRGEGPDGKMRDTLAKQEGEQFGAHLKAGTTSAGSIQDLDMLDQLIKVAPTGPLTGRLAQMFPGFSDGATAFQSIVSRVAPTLRVEGSGATSDIEYQGMLNSLPSLVNRPEANQAVSQMMRAKAQVNLERAEVVRELQGRRITPDDARARIAEIDKRSIITPELRQMLSFGKPQPSAPKQGDVVDGWRFKGGNPADRNAWEKTR
jgi:hypothetical protein